MLDDYVWCGLTMTCVWLFSFFAVTYATALLFSRFEILLKPEREDTRRTKLRSMAKRNLDDLENEDPRQDVVYAGMKRASGWITQRIAVSNPCGSLIVSGFMGICAAIYIISIAITMSQFTARDWRINSIDEIALRSQQSTLYKKTNVCVQQDFQTYLEGNIYLDEDRISYRHRPDEFFDYQAFSMDNSMTACTGILVYQSFFLSASEPNVK